MMNIMDIKSYQNYILCHFTKNAYPEISSKIDFFIIYEFKNRLKPWSGI